MDFKHGKLHACARCKGCFLPGDVSTEVPRIQAWFDARAHSKSAVEESAVACPEGHGPMRAVELHGHQLDVCMQCHGFWFDADELKRLQKGNAAVAAAAAGGAAAGTATGTSGSESSSGVGDAVELVVDVADGVLSLLDLF
jgi:Transcription factor zinc-finger